MVTLQRVGMGTLRACPLLQVEAAPPLVGLETLDPKHQAAITSACATARLQDRPEAAQQVDSQVWRRPTLIGARRYETQLPVWVYLSPLAFNAVALRPKPKS